MIREGSVELDSYRLANYAVQAPCYICRGGNTFDAELCRHCHAPMALAHQANSQKVRPRMIAVVGASGVGKTVYLGMLLDMLTRLPDRLQTLARGAFSVNLQQATTVYLSRNEFPLKTPCEPDRWSWVHCQVLAARQRQPVELIMPDMAGEALLEEIEHPGSYEVIRSLLSKSSGVLALVDASELDAGAVEPDYFAIKLLSYLLELNDDPKTGWGNRPIGLVFTKADECEACFLDPAAYAQQHANGTWRLCRERFRDVAFFASGVAGASAYRDVPREGRMHVPLRIEPRGVIEPFEWLVDHVKG